MKQNFEWDEEKTKANLKNTESVLKKQQLLFLDPFSITMFNSTSAKKNVKQRRIKPNQWSQPLRHLRFDYFEFL